MRGRRSPRCLAASRPKNRDAYESAVLKRGSLMPKSPIVKGWAERTAKDRPSISNRYPRLGTGHSYTQLTHPKLDEIATEVRPKDERTPEAALIESRRIERLQSFFEFLQTLDHDMMTVDETGMVITSFTGNLIHGDIADFLAELDEHGIITILPSGAVWLKAHPVLSNSFQSALTHPDETAANIERRLASLMRQRLPLERTRLRVESFTQTKVHGTWFWSGVAAVAAPLFVLRGLLWEWEMGWEETAAIAVGSLGPLMMHIRGHWYLGNRYVPPVARRVVNPSQWRMWAYYGVRTGPWLEMSCEIEALKVALERLRAGKPIAAVPFDYHTRTVGDTDADARAAMIDHVRLHGQLPSGIDTATALAEVTRAREMTRAALPRDAEVVRDLEAQAEEAHEEAALLVEAGRGEAASARMAAAVSLSEEVREKRSFAAGGAEVGGTSPGSGVGAGVGDLGDGARKQTRGGMRDDDAEYRFDAPSATSSVSKGGVSHAPTGTAGPPSEVSPPASSAFTSPSMASASATSSPPSSPATATASASASASASNVCTEGAEDAPPLRAAEAAARRQPYMPTANVAASPRPTPAASSSPSASSPTASPASSNLSPSKSSISTSTSSSSTSSNANPTATPSPLPPLAHNLTAADPWDVKAEATGRSPKKPFSSFGMSSQTASPAGSEDGDGRHASPSHHRPSPSPSSLSQSPAAEPHQEGLLNKLRRWVGLGPLKELDPPAAGLGQPGPTVSEAIRAEEETVEAAEAVVREREQAAWEAALRTASRQLEELAATGGGDAGGGGRGFATMSGEARRKAVEARAAILVDLDNPHPLVRLRAVRRLIVGSAKREDVIAALTAAPVPLAAEVEEVERQTKVQASQRASTAVVEAAQQVVKLLGEYGDGAKEGGSADVATSTSMSSASADVPVAAGADPATQPSSLSPPHAARTHSPFSPAAIAAVEAFADALDAAAVGAAALSEEAEAAILVANNVIASATAATGGATRAGGADVGVDNERASGAVGDTAAQPSASSPDPWRPATILPTPASVVRAPVLSHPLYPTGTRVSTKPAVVVGRHDRPRVNPATDDGRLRLSPGDVRYLRNTVRAAHIEYAMPFSQAVIAPSPHGDADELGGRSELSALVACGMAGTLRNEKVPSQLARERLSAIHQDSAEYLPATGLGYLPLPHQQHADLHLLDPAERTLRHGSEPASPSSLLAAKRLDASAREGGGEGEEGEDDAGERPLYTEDVPLTVAPPVNALGVAAKRARRVLTAAAVGVAVPSHLLRSAAATARKASMTEARVLLATSSFASAVKRALPLQGNPADHKREMFGDVMGGELSTDESHELELTQAIPAFSQPFQIGEVGSLAARMSYDAVMSELGPRLTRTTPSGRHSMLYAARFGTKPLTGRPHAIFWGRVSQSGHPLWIATNAGPYASRMAVDVDATYAPTPTFHGRVRMFIHKNMSPYAATVDGADLSILTSKSPYHGLAAPTHSDTVSAFNASASRVDEAMQKVAAMQRGEGGVTQSTALNADDVVRGLEGSVTEAADAATSMEEVMVEKERVEEETVARVQLQAPRGEMVDDGAGGWRERSRSE